MRVGGQTANPRIKGELDLSRVSLPPDSPAAAETSPQLPPLTSLGS
ncbi:hypothetical protein RYO59_000716 [Thermosynechococcaceae cyanobacterium Okahandja]